MKTLIAAAMLLALTTSAHAAPRGEWFLTLDAWFCSTRSCAIAGPPHEPDGPCNARRTPHSRHTATLIARQIRS